MPGTEDASGRYASIEDWSSADLVTGIIESQIAGVAAVQPAASAIARAVDEAVERLTLGGRLVYAGAGTSGRLATLDASELPPTFAWPYERAVSIMAGGESALVRAVEGAEDNTGAARAALADLTLAPNDVVVALAASGRTPFAIAALDYAREVGALAVGIYNNREGTLGEASDIAILLDTGPEFVAGSTRMKAGTAQKVALNCFSTAVMIRLGLVYRGKMVEMQVTNSKLRGRAEKMIAELADCDLATAGDALTKADGSIKLATVMLIKSLSRADAEALLEHGGGRLGAALR